MFLLILFIVVTVAINRLYHKVFNVMYFGFAAVLTEWIICFLIAAVIVGAIIG